MAGVEVKEDNAPGGLRKSDNQREESGNKMRLAWHTCNAERAPSSGSNESWLPRVGPPSSPWEIERDKMLQLWENQDVAENMKAAGDAYKTICSYAGEEPERAKLQVLAAMNEGEVAALDELMARVRAVKNWRIWKETGSRGSQSRSWSYFEITDLVRSVYETLMGLDGRKSCSESETAIILSALPQPYWEGVAKLDSRMRMSRNLPAMMSTAGEENADCQKAGRTCTSSLWQLLHFR